jgi:hypothetical protein
MPHIYCEFFKFEIKCFLFKKKLYTFFYFKINLKLYYIKLLAIFDINNVIFLVIFKKDSIQYIKFIKL